MLRCADACRGFDDVVGRAREDAELLVRTLLSGEGVAGIRDAKGRTPLELAVESRKYMVNMFDRSNDRTFGGATGRVTEYKRLEGAIRFLGGEPDDVADGIKGGGGK